MSDATDLCPYCRSPYLFTVRCETGPHYARTGCRDCDRHVRFEPAPMTDERSAAFIMPIGKHRGTPLRDVPTDYLVWFIGQPNIKDSLRRHMEHELNRRKGQS